MDLYFEKNYGKLYEKLENGQCEVFEFVHPLGTVRHLFIKRQILAPHSPETYYDIVTPYGYGGPLISSCAHEKKAELVSAFGEAFRDYCDEQRIVSEFVRFHPILGNAAEFTGLYDVTYLRQTVGTNLKDYEDPVQAEFSKSTRKSIRQALRAGVEYRVTVNPEQLDSFQAIYHETMQRIGADAYYHFDKRYFSACVENFGEQTVLVEALFEGQVIGAELHFLSGKTIHTHLSGTLSEFHHLFPVYVMTYAIVQWGKENGYELVHAGGGKTNQPDDSLFLFKKKFGKNTEFAFYIGRKVWNEKIYLRLCRAAGAAADESFFPAYRSPAVQSSNLLQQAE